MDCQTEKTGDASQTQHNKSKNDNSKSHTVLAMALTASLTVLVVFIATFILLQLKIQDPIKIELTDWLKMILPIVGGAMVTVFAFLGVDRLKNFDERQDRLEKELRNDLNTLVDNAVSLVQPRLNKTYQEWEQSLQEKLKKYDDQLIIVENSITKYNKVIGSVEKLEEVSDTIGNVAEAQRFIAELFSNASASTSEINQRKRILLALLERVKSGAITGDSNDYHNMSSELARQDYYEFAADVTQIGLNKFPENIDLLSDYAYYSHKAGRKENVIDGINRLEHTNKNIWNWRAFTFYIDVLNDGKANEENKKKALECVESYKKLLPNEERAYMAEYETYKKYGEFQAAEKALEDAEGKLSMTAQCSLALSEIYHMRGDYDKAINSATRAILGQAETQPSSSTGAAFAYRGFSKDARIHRTISEGTSIETQYAEINSAISDYKMAIQLGYSHANIAVRLKILQKLLPVEMQDNASVADLVERIDKLEFTLGLLLQKLTADDGE